MLFLKMFLNRKLRCFQGNLEILKIEDMRHMSLKLIKNYKNFMKKSISSKINSNNNNMDKEIFCLKKKI